MIGQLLLRLDIPSWQGMIIQWFIPAFQRQEHRKSAIKWEKINGQQNFLALGRCNIFCHSANNLPTACPSIFDDLVARNTMVVTRNLVAMAKSRRLFRLLIFKIFTRGRNHKKKLQAYFTQLPLSIANLRTAPHSSAYLPEIAWNKLWNA